MNVAHSLSQIASHGHRVFDGGPAHSLHPMFGLFAVIPIVLGVAVVAAIVFVAWKVGAYYGAAKKKL